MAASEADQTGGNDTKTLFVRGISWDTESKDLKDYFAKFGAISRVYLKTDPNTGQHVGFGFVGFASQDSVEEVLKNGPHTLKGKRIYAERGKARPGVKKIFVGGLASDIPEADIRTYFEQFGKIETIELPFDKVRKQRRQFCFITFESVNAVNEVCKIPKQKIGNKVCDVRKATLNPDPRSTSGGGAYGQSRGTGTQSFSGYNQYNEDYGYVNFGNYNSSAYGTGYDQGPFRQLERDNEYGAYSLPAAQPFQMLGSTSLDFDISVRMPRKAPGYDYSRWNNGQGRYGDAGYSQQLSSNGRIRREASRNHPYNR